MVTASGAVLEHILDGTYPIWNEGITRKAYAQWNQAQMATEWGRRHLRRVALTDDGRVLSSAKEYRFRAFADGRAISVLGIGAVFTPEDKRGQGHARALVEQMVAHARADGCDTALLFSEIGATYYEQMGFRALPRPICDIEVPRGARGAPATLVRSAESSDLDAIADIAARYRESAAFALDRPADLIAFGVARRRLLAGLGPPGLRDVEFFVAE